MPKFRRLNKISITIGLVLLTLMAQAQPGGKHVYEFLNVTNSARIAAVGGNFLAVKDNDLTTVLANPSFIDEDMNRRLAFSFTEYFSDINYGFASYSHTFRKVGSFAGTFQFIDYGRFLRTDETGQALGNFSAGEYALVLGWGRHLSPHFTLGSNLKIIYSHLDKLNSFGMAVDVAGSYFSEKHKLALSLMFRNIGRQLDAYIPGNIEPLPFEIQMGVSKQFGKLPVKFHILVNHLEKWDLTYEDPNNPTPVVDPLTGDSLPPKKFEKWLDKLGRHFVFGLEFSPVKVFTLRFGYNYERRKTLHIDAKRGMTGFSYGFGLHISRFDFSYARVHYALGGTPNYITIATNITEFLSKKAKKTVTD